MWQIEPSTQWEKDLKWYAKKRPDELAAVLANLSRYMKYLQASKHSKCVEAGFLHHEPAGVVALDQKGFAGNLQETRLYLFAVDEAKTVHLITIGSKNEQHADIEFWNFAKALLSSFGAAKVKNHETDTQHHDHQE